MDSVSTFNILLEGCKGTIIKSLFAHYPFPKVSIMEVNICAKRSASDRVIEATYVQSIIGAVFPDAEAFPNLRQLQFIINVEGPLGGDQPVSIPFSSFPTLEHLELTTYATTISELPDGVQLPTLRSLTLTDCLALERHWIKNLLRQLQAQESRRRDHPGPLRFTIDGVPRPDFLEPGDSGVVVTIPGCGPIRIFSFSAREMGEM